MQLTIEFTDRLTWGELIGFVDAARPHATTGQLVDIVPIENETDWIPDRIRVELPSATPSAKVIDEEQARNFRAALQAVLDNQGDARIVLSELTQLRDVLG
jgi:hypothetical protein